MILSDGQIEELLEKKMLKIENFSEDNLTPNGYDLTIEEVSIKGEDPVDGGEVTIPPQTWFAVSTREYVKFPPEVAGELWIRTTWARKGVLASFGMIDAGFEGNLTLSAYNTSREITIPIGGTFAQMVFHKLGRRSDKLYEERSGNYQGSKGINL
ncbi:MAG: dCTP deaminase domain-containing protein [Candidatus Saliniplasma sp.]